MVDKSFAIDWGIFALVEFLVSCSDEIGIRYKTAIDIGSGEAKHSEILRAAGLEVFQLDKYSDSADYKGDFIKYDFDRKFDVVFCSHVIEHQRNVGNFLDKIFDVMSGSGLLIISAPKHQAEILIEGHLNCFFTTYFVQHLIHAGFDVKNGKYLSCGAIENAAIVPKAKNFDFREREEVGYRWTEKHQERSFIELKPQEVENNLRFFHNCHVVSSPEEGTIQFLFPDNYKKYGIHIDAKRWGFTITI